MYGLSQAQASGWTGTTVVGALAAAVVAGVMFVVHERRSADPLMDFALLRGRRNYLGATISQFIGGMAEMGLAIIFPLLLVLNLGMTPAMAGLALIPTTVPMIIVAPLGGRWYDRSGGRPPLIAGFGLLATSGVVLALGTRGASYATMLPGLVIFGIGLALILTVNDPVSLDMVPEADHGQASGVSATAEQGGGAIGIALLYLVFHAAYRSRLNAIIDHAAALPNLDSTSGPALRRALVAAEATGLDRGRFDPNVVKYLDAADRASSFGYSAAFLGVTVLALAGVVAAALLVRRPPALIEPPVVPDDGRGADLQFA